MSNQWNPDMDSALVMYINRLCQHLSISPARLHPHEIYLTEAELASIDYASLQGELRIPCAIKHVIVVHANFLPLETKTKESYY